MVNFEQRTNCGNVTSKDISNEPIMVCGWVSNYRDQGGVVFVDLRDRSGLLQVVFDLAQGEELIKQAEKLRSEFVIQVTGILRGRGEGSINPKLATGEVEVFASKLIILNKSNTLPIPIQEHEEVANEELRLKYRYLDLRREEMQNSLKTRHKFNHSIRNFLNDKEFWEIETPILNKSTPEGARDFLVPSRVNPGQFYALPQSPQIYKQILMCSQAERYYQIARCFRDEDLRSDRQPEFTQIDIEMSFINEKQIMSLMEEMFIGTFKEVFNFDIEKDVEHISYHDAMENYGNDKPDMRFNMQLIELGDWVAKTEFQVFKNSIKNGGRVKALCVPGGSTLSRKDIEELTKWVSQDFKAKGLAWIKHTENGLESVIAKFLPDEAKQELIQKANSKVGDIIFFVADTADVVLPTLSALRLKLAEQFNVIPKNTWKLVWVVDFPLFEKIKGTNQFTSLHHPFTSPISNEMKKVIELGNKKSLTAEEEQEILNTKSNAYDMVLNGVEIGGGSIRIHDQDLQKSIFNLLGISPEEAEDRFGFLLKALQFGAPPHGGIAYGVDRILMLGLGFDSIRDVIAFPKTQKGQCVMSSAPSDIDPAQLIELQLRSLAKKP